MSNPSKKRGTAVEVKVRDYMRDALGQPGIERQPLRGTRDQGDLAGLAVHGFTAIVEVKADRDMGPSDLAEYRRQTIAEREHACADVGVLVTWRYKHGAAEAVAHVTLRDLALLVPELTLAEGMGEFGDAHWVQMTLAEFCKLAKD